MEGTTASDTAQIGITIAEWMLPLVAAAATWAGKELAQWLRARKKNTTVMGMLARLTDSAVTVVNAMEQTVVREIKAGKDPSSPAGDRLTKEEVRDVRDAALAALKAYWGAKGIKELGSVLGMDSGDLQHVMVSKIESAVRESKDPPQSPPQ